MKGRDYLIIRLSALGDVAMTLPLLYELADSYPHDRFFLVTRPFMSKLLVNPPTNLSAIPFDPSKEKGGAALFRFARSLHQLSPQAVVVDLHDVLRTKLLRYTLRLHGHRVVALQKPRKARRRLLSRPQELRVPRSLYLPSMISLYQATLQRAGLETPMGGRVVIDRSSLDSYDKVGIAPYAQHRGKMLPLDRVEHLIAMILDRYPTVGVVLYGAPGNERESNEALAHKFNERVHLSQGSGLQSEIKEIASLRVMISMDSANQHIAAMVGTPVVSIWGATHPAAGFLPFRGDEENCIGVDLPCRPCSTFGQIPCKRGDYTCLITLPLESVVSALEPFVGASCE